MTAVWAVAAVALTVMVFITVSALQEIEDRRRERETIRQVHEAAHRYRNWLSFVSSKPRNSSAIILPFEPGRVPEGISTSCGKQRFRPMPGDPTTRRKPV